MMEVKLENLIEKIKKEGVVEAQKVSEETIENAKEEAAKIVSNAKEEAAGLIEKAKREAEQFKNNSENALRQAGRDLVLKLKDQLVKLFDRVLKRSVVEELSPEFLKDLIVKIVNNWSVDKNSSLEIIVSSKDKQKLEELILSSFKKEAENTITVKTSNNVTKGFRIGIKGENAHYDFTDDSILESLKELMSPNISKVLNG